jgi:hypothetical protein
VATEYRSVSGITAINARLTPDDRAARASFTVIVDTGLPHAIIRGHFGRGSPRSGDRGTAPFTDMTLFARKSRKPRQKVERQAWFAGDGDFALRPCTVVDMSSDGARLRIEDAARLPGKFRLTFSRSTREGFRCDLRWRRGQTVGVKFSA